MSLFLIFSFYASASEPAVNDVKLLVYQDPKMGK